MKIGFFDSGLGGLLVMKSVINKLPEYDYEYFGDTKNLPYGDKTEDQIYEFTKGGVEELFKKDCGLVILACNTASAETLRRLQDEFLPSSVFSDRRILGVIIPVVEEVIISGSKKVLLLATNRTISSGKYHLELGKRNEIDTKIEALATPNLVPLLEEGDIEEAVLQTSKIINERLSVSTPIDGVILGCTHYNLMLDRLREIYPNLKFFAQTEIIPTKIVDYLFKHPEIENKLTRKSIRNIFLTEHRPDYDQHMQELLNGKFISEQ